MSSIVNKIKDAVHGDKHTSSSEPTGSHGPHDSRTANAADPRVDSDRDGRATHGTTGTTGTSGLGSSTHTGTTGTTGTYGSNTTGTTGLTGSSGDNYTGTGISGAPGGTSSTGAYGSTNAGPHSSNLANKADPRVDSDRDGRATHGTTGTSGLGSSTHGTTGTSGLGSSTHGATGTGYGSTNAGPHSSNLANKADPRVDSDRDGRATHGTTGLGSSTHGATGTTGAGYGTGQYGEVGSATTGTTRSGEYGSSTTGYGSTNAGPHSSNLANKADPRVDSDRDGRATHGTTGTSGLGSSTHGTTGTSGLGSSTHGTTGTGYGSNTTGAGVGGLGSSNPGPAPNTAGPHKQDFLNKADPRVDSDRDGSKTLGQDKTYASQGNTSSTYNKDPTDAAQVPPSVLAKHIGEPSLEHDAHDHDRARRNSRATHQESHVGL